MVDAIVIEVETMPVHSNEVAGGSSVQGTRNVTPPRSARRAAGLATESRRTIGLAHGSERRTVGTMSWREWWGIAGVVGVAGVAGVEVESDCREWWDIAGHAGA